MVRCFSLALAASLSLALATGAFAQAAAPDAKAAPKAAANAEGKAAPQKAAARCVMAGGEANMITQDLAEFMAKAALKNSIKGMNAQPTGPLALKCNQNGALQYCKATQRACK